MFCLSLAHVRIRNDTYVMCSMDTLSALIGAHLNLGYVMWQFSITWYWDKLQQHMQAFSYMLLSMHCWALSR